MNIYAVLFGALAMSAVYAAMEIGLSPSTPRLAVEGSQSAPTEHRRQKRLVGVIGTLLGIIGETVRDFGRRINSVGMRYPVRDYPSIRRPDSSSGFESEQNLQRDSTRIAYRSA